MRGLPILLLCGTLGCHAISGLDDFGETANRGSGGGGGGASMQGGGGTVGEGGGGQGGTGQGGGVGGDLGYAGVVLGDDPIAYWRLGEEQGQLSAADAVGPFSGVVDGNNVSFGHEGLITGDTDSAMRVLGTNGNRIRVENSDELAFQGDFTIEAWLRREAIDYGNVVDKANDITGTPYSGYQLWIGGTNNDNIYFTVWDPNGDVKRIRAEGLAPAVGVRIHLVARLQEDEMCLYIDAEEARCELVDFTLGAASAPLHVGRSFDGILDEVALYDHALADVRITAHRDAGL